MPQSKTEATFIKEAYRVKEILAIQDQPNFSLTFELSGRCSSGDLKFEVTLKEEWGLTVSGNSVDAVVAEFLRRKGYSALHEPLCLPAVIEEQDNA